jgi:DnaJ-class molecular chaperone
MNHYQVLRVHPDASASEIEEAFRAAIERRSSRRAFAWWYEALCGRTEASVRSAFDVLNDPGRRAEYGRCLGPRTADEWTSPGH